MAKAPYFEATEVSPIRFVIETNGVCCIMQRVVLGGKFLWYGYPYVNEEKGKRPTPKCKVAMLIEANGTVHHGPALNYICDGGPSTGQRARERYDQVRAQVKHAFLSHVLTFYSEAQMSDDTHTLGEELGTYLATQGWRLVDEASTHEDELSYGLLGMPAEIAIILRSMGWSAIPDMQEKLAARVPPGFATVTEMEWDGFSERVALSNNLTAGEELFMRRAGIGFIHTATAARQVVKEEQAPTVAAEEVVAVVAEAA